MIAISAQMDIAFVAKMANVCHQEHCVAPKGNPGAVLVVLVVLQQIVKMSQLVNLCHTAK